MVDKRYLVTKTLVDDETGRKYLTNNLYPDVPVSPDDWYLITSAGDRYDVLSQRFYSTPEFWWVIAVANEQPVDTLCPPLGIQLRVPANPSEYVTLLERENS